MKRYYSILATMVFMVAFSLVLSQPAHALSGFSDITLDSSLAESVEYLAEHGIIKGTGGGQFSPEKFISVRQWAVMLCRAYELESHEEPSEFGTSCIQCCLEKDWLQMTAFEEPDSRMCWSAILESAFHVIDLPVYDYELYPEGVKLSSWENYLRIGRELGLCGQEAVPAQLVTRGDAAKLLFCILTQSFEVSEPPQPIPIQNHTCLSLNDYLVELRRVPEPILHAFQEQGWMYIIDFGILEAFSKQYDMGCIGITTYSKKQICVSASEATVHEIGHFLHCDLDFPPEFERLFRKESSSARSLLRDYSLTNSHEYFADCFTFWVTNSGNEQKLAAFQDAAPGTYQFFFSLEQENWSRYK